MTSFSVDFDKGTAEKSHIRAGKDFDLFSSTLSNIVSAKLGQEQVIISGSDTSKTTTLNAKTFEFSAYDDYVLTDNKLINLADKKTHDLGHTACAYKRVKGSGNAVQVLRQCDQKVHLLSLSDSKVSETLLMDDSQSKTRGKINNAWQGYSNLGAKEQVIIVKFDDLSLKSFKGGNKLTSSWLRHEGLSQLTQVEIADPQTSAN